jgi:hypothetical protein
MRLAHGALRRLAGFVGGLALLGMASSAFAQWTEHRFAEGYRIEFPGTPKSFQQEVQTAVGPIKIYTQSLNRNGLDFFSAYNRYPNDAPPERRLEGARDGAVKNVKGILREEESLTIGGAPAKRIIIDVPDPRVVGVQLIVVRGNSLYQAVVVGPVGSESSPDVARFINSFALEPQ